VAKEENELSSFATMLFPCTNVDYPYLKRTFLKFVCTKFICRSSELNFDKCPDLKECAVIMKFINNTHSYPFIPHNS
jgi:hypothetical protein